MPVSTAVPTRKTSERDLDLWNQQFRASDVYQNFMKSHGLPTNGRVKLSDQMQEALERALAQSGVRIPDGMHIDQGGNLNQKNNLWRNVGIGAAVTGATLTGLGAAGIGPMSGVFGAGGAAGAAGSAGAAGGGAAIAGGAPWAVTPLAAPVAASGAAAGGGGLGLGTISALKAGVGAAQGAANGGGLKGAVTGAATSAVPGGDMGQKDWLLPLILAGAGATQGALTSKSNRDIAEQQAQNSLDIAKITDARDRDIAAMDVAAKEGQSDPFRDLLAQIQAAALFDQLAGYKPMQMDFSDNPYAKYIPKVSGGSFSYDVSPELRAAAEAARGATLRGEGQSATMTNPENWGVTGALNLTGKQPVYPGQMGAPQSALPEGASSSVLRAPMPMGADPTAPTSGTMPVDDPFRLSIDDPRMGRAARRVPRRRRLPAAGAAGRGLTPAVV
ncbi:MAG: hypothetical protein AB7O67_23240 [Vicinamibacterales bacterium]